MFLISSAKIKLITFKFKFIIHKLFLRSSNINCLGQFTVPFKYTFWKVNAYWQIELNYNKSIRTTFELRYKLCLNITVKYLL